MKKSNEVFSQKILKFNRRIQSQFVLSFLIVIFLLLGQSPLIAQAQQNSLRIHFIDVGYGDAILIEFPDAKNLLIDAGEKEFSKQIVSYLQSLNILSIDQAVITHPHANHFEGFFEILKIMPVGRVYTNGELEGDKDYELLLDKFQENDISINNLVRGDFLINTPKNVSIECLYPQNMSGKPNDRSLVLKLEYKDVSVLFMGDVELNGQKELIAMSDKIGEVDIIKVPHHGGPLSDAFIQTFTDKIFIITTGQNKKNWPHESDLVQLKGEVYRTDIHGTIMLESNGEMISIVKNK